MFSTISKLIKLTEASLLVEHNWQRSGNKSQMSKTDFWGSPVDRIKEYFLHGKTNPYGILSTMIFRVIYSGNMAQRGTFLNYNLKKGMFLNDFCLHNNLLG